MILGKTTRELKCAICKLVIRVGDLAWFDATKSQGSHMVHQGCYTALKAKRAELGQEMPKPKKGAPKKSSEVLDAPF